VVVRPENGSGLKSRDTGKALSNGSKVSAVYCNSELAAAAAANGRHVGGHADSQDSASCTVLPYNNNMQETSATTATEIRQKCCDSASIEAKHSPCTSELGLGQQGGETEEAGQVAMISACSPNTSPADTTVALPNNVEQGPLQTDAAYESADSDKDGHETQQIIAEAYTDRSSDPTALSELDAPSVEQDCCGNGSSAERELMTSNGQPTDSGRQTDSVPAAAAASDWYPGSVQSNAADDLACVSEDEGIATACYSSQTDSTILSTIVGDDNDDVTDADTGSQDDVVTTPVDVNYFTVVPRDRDSSKPSDSDSLLGFSSSRATSSGERTGGDGSDNCVGSITNNDHVEQRICEIAAELSERDSSYIITARKSRDQSYVEDTDEKILRLEQTCDRLTRENAALSDLLSAKKIECVETRQWYRGRVKDLEDDVSRLKMEKCRLLDRLQLPESERASLTAEENAFSELRTKLEDAEERLEAARAENAELRQDLRDAELAMQELHDQFQAEESLELRELQRELENTSRDCRLLHFKVWRHRTRWRVFGYLKKF
jgi:hypothetical protein